MTRRFFSATLVDSESTADGEQHLQFMSSVIPKAGDGIVLHGIPCSTIPETSPPGFHIYLPTASKPLYELDQTLLKLQLVESQFRRFVRYSRLVLVGEGMHNTHALVSLLKCIQNHHSMFTSKLRRLRIAWLVQPDEDWAKVEWMLKYQLQQDKLLKSGLSVEFTLFIKDDGDNVIELKRAINALDGVNWPVNVVRAPIDFSQVLQQEANYRSRLLPVKIGVFTCTSDAMLQQVTKAIFSHGKKFTLHQGRFDH
ncbi:hypothetical protein BASA81_003266 [Batrachochytrium salamandrivorans]|nr:hypothetical protein BASA81_003266 [Batrachochytrium salamandrivorans]